MPVDFYVFTFSVFLIPNIILRMPLKNFGLLNKTTFIKQHL